MANFFYFKNFASEIADLSWVHLKTLENTPDDESTRVFPGITSSPVALHKLLFILYVTISDFFIDLLLCIFSIDCKPK